MIIHLGVLALQEVTKKASHNAPSRDLSPRSPPLYIMSVPSLEENKIPKMGHLRRMWLM